MSPTSTKRREPMLAPDPIAAAKEREGWTGVSRLLTGLLGLALTWAAVLGLAAFLGWPFRHSMWLGLVGSTVYLIVRDRRRRATSTAERIEHRRRWRSPIAWPRPRRSPSVARDATERSTAGDAPRRRLGPRGGHALSGSTWGELLLWIILGAMAVTAVLVYLAYSSQMS